ncbi:hypothetical protein GOBAR_AA34654 [Gossypium barbadense]|uniref:DUF4283 domain-containing protein n=1 Tax=Gossypium barbadense TaxID=3634 RepID=A0A2P5W4P7_GOSBA|nr:hypothetical protein GOBAR_AA34654 [Gossypium barbadense]
MEISLNSSDNVSHLEIKDGDGSWTDVNHNTKKFHFKEGNGKEITDMLVESGPSLILSWKDKLLRNKSGASNKLGLDNSGAGANEDMEFYEGDIHRSIVNGIPAIDFSERIQQILFKEMEHMVVLKLLGRNIGYGALNNRIISLWNTSKPFHLMDIENGYFLAKFYSTNDYAKVLSQGLQRFLYRRKILEEIGETIGKVVQLNFNTNGKVRGRFARMAIYVNLDKPLIAQEVQTYQGVVCFAVIKFNSGEGSEGYYFEKGCKRKRICFLLAVDVDQKEKDKLNKKDTGKLAGFKNKLKIEENVMQQGFKTRVKALAGQTPIEPAFAIGVIESTALKVVIDPSSSSMNQPNDVSDTKSSLQNNESVSSFPFLNDSTFKVSTGAETFKASTNCSNSTPVIVSCFSLIFVVQEVSEDGGPALLTKPASPLSEPVEVQVVDSSGGLNPNRHIVVSFKEKDSADGAQLKGATVSASGAGKRIQE